MRAISDHNLAILSNAYLFVCPINFFEGLADFAYGSISTDAVDDLGHGVRVTDAAVGTDNWFLGSGVFQGVEPAAKLFVVTAFPQRLQFFGLALGYGFINVERDRRLFFDGKFVHTDDDLLFGFGRALELIGSLSNLFLRIAQLNGLDHAAHGVETVKIVESALLHIECELLHKV